jgi:hypothetical protein
MSDIDERIRTELSAEDQRFLARLDAGGSLYQDLAAAFQGRMRWLNILGSVIGLLLFIAAVYCAWRFLTVDDPRSVRIWGGGAALAFLGNAMIKLWFWIEVKSNGILREVKRVELRVASLAAALRGGQGGDPQGTPRHQAL